MGQASTDGHILASLGKVSASTSALLYTLPKYARCSGPCAQLQLYLCGPHVTRPDRSQTAQCNRISPSCKCTTPPDTVCSLNLSPGEYTTSSTRRQGAPPMKNDVMRSRRDPYQKNTNRTGQPSTVLSSCADPLQAAIKHLRVTVCCCACYPIPYRWQHTAAATICSCSLHSHTQRGFCPFCAEKQGVRVCCAQATAVSGPIC
jgi:hypothetical protein